MPEQGKGKKSEADWAVDLLIENQEPIYYMNLLDQICAKMGRTSEPTALTSMYTRLNLDNRLVHQCDGYWFYDTNRVNRDV